MSTRSDDDRGPVVAAGHRDGVDIPWVEGRAANLANWEERVAIHERAYGLERYRRDRAHLSRVVRDDLDSMAPFLGSDGLGGQRVCHLQCHIGTDTLSLARAGAAVVGVDFSPAALASARSLAEQLGLAAQWVRSDVLDAAEAVLAEVGRADFDLVYTSIGTICWLGDLHRWAQQIAALLRPGGLFYIRDGHPSLLSLDETDPGLRIRYRYFGDGTAQQWDDEHTYAGDEKVTATRTYEWPHPLSEVVTALIDAGLTIRALREGQVLPWRFSPAMEEVDGGWAYPADRRDLVPCTFTIIASAPDTATTV